MRVRVRVLAALGALRLRAGEMQGDAERCGEMQGDAGRCGEMWGDAGRYGLLVRLRALDVDLGADDYE